MKKTEVFLIIVNDRFYFRGLSPDKKVIHTTKNITEARLHLDYDHAKNSIHGFPDLGNDSFYKIEKIFIDPVAAPQEPPSISYEEACSFDEKSTNESQKL